MITGWQVLKARIPIECDGMHCGHQLIAAGDTVHVLPDAEHAGEKTTLCEHCWQAGLSEAPPAHGTIS